VYCNQCGQPITAGDRFCKHCGAELGAWAAELPPPPAAALPAESAPPGPPSRGPGRPGRANAPLIIGVAVLAAILVAGIVLISRGGSSSDDETATAGATTVVAGVAPTSLAPPPPVSVPPGGFTADQINQTFGDAIWKVQISGCGEQGWGSGFAIGPRHIVTNWHVVVGDTEPTLVSHDGSRTIAGHVIGLNQKPDVAVIEVDEDLPTYIGWADTSALTEGQALTALGFPLPQGNYTVTQLSIASFETTGDKRTGILADGKIDRGNSGGPSLTADGHVAGINTAVNINGISEGGLQTVPYLTSADAVRGLVDGYVASGSTTTVPADCAKAGDYKQAKTYGDNAQLDALWEQCAAGLSAACDALALNATPQTDYYLFGVTCGGRVGREGYCEARYGPQLPSG
jgi:S1-C subfamily serine protease